MPIRALRGLCAANTRNALESRGLLHLEPHPTLGKELMPLVSHRSFAAFGIGAMLAALTAVAGLPARAVAVPIKSSDIIELNTAVQDSSRSPVAVARIRRFLADKPDSVYNVFLRQLLLTGLITSNSPG